MCRPFHVPLGNAPIPSPGERFVIAPTYAQRQCYTAPPFRNGAVTHAYRLPVRLTYLSHDRYFFPHRCGFCRPHRAQIMLPEDRSGSAHERPNGHPIRGPVRGEHRRFGLR
ncbi:hypothetical protein B5566_23605 [Mycobacterium sp. MHSD3]|nr:hypothetical protein DYE20_21280 [[Mycobacterium] chelonae subsp. gwanakae]PKQ55541.1 hypothetical protein B5566_23605 [Mycobacterium sp. MHSD3]